MRGTTMWLPLDVPHVAFTGAFRTHAVQDLLHPRTRGVDERARRHFRRRAVGGSQRHVPQATLAVRARHLRVDADVRAACLRVERVDDDQSRIVDARVGVDEAFAEPRLEPRLPSGFPPA